FNGEIYNFQELRRDLEKKKYKFKTQTDTEVILALYAEYGVKSFSMLRGMFAFGLYDSKNKKLLLVKDHYGIKPLYYYSDGEKIIFASTVRAVAESGLFSIKKSQKAMIGFLLFGSVPLPITTIEGILAVPAGYYMEASLNGERKLVKYYDALDAFLKKSNDDFEDAKVKVKNLIEESIRFHLISDAPLGIFLSGGLDSSTIAALSAEVLRGGGFRHKINTLSVVFNEKEFSEKKYQQLVVDRVKSRHREIKITKGDFEKNFDEIFEAMDQPTIDGVNTYFISKAAKEAEVKTVLSGLGSDEIFMGYSSFKKAVLLRKIQKFPKILKFPLRIFSLFGGRLAKLNYLKKDTPLNFYLTIRGLFTPKEVAKILSINEQEVENFIGELNNSITNNSITKLHPADLLSYFELKFYLQNQLLKDTDFMSMRHSIEIRVPFLDHPLVEYLSSLRPDVKLKNIKIQEYKNINKSLLVEAVRELLPQEIFTRPKMGFTFPFQEWMKGIDSNFKGGHWSRHWAMGVLNKFN
ncbi:asparagine synthase (glutamine-hydrolyzing), partial [Candidatus Wolfebacteria bacterium]|nr:asparagine synthase (glutamine-hydrolyzing) [Candidatus Wolfebacteria bacterium]